MLATSLGFGLAFFVAAFASALVGLAFRAHLAERLRLEHARDMVGGVTGLAGMGNGLSGGIHGELGDADMREPERLFYIKSYRP